MKNYGLVTTWSERGAGYVSRAIADILGKDDSQEVFIYARGGEEFQKEGEWSNYNVVYDSTARLPMPTGMDMGLFKRWLVDNSIDVVIFNEQRYYYPVELCRRLEIITVLYVDYYTKDGYKLLYGFDALICNTKRHYNVFKNHRQAIYIPWGTSKESYPFSEKDRPFDFFHSAGMNPKRKGTDVYIKALTHLARDNYKFRALIHTQVDILKFFPELRDSLKILQEGGLLKIVHATVTAPGLYNQAFSYIYPSRLDGIGLTVPEALMSGCYVLTSNEEPMSEFIKKDDNGSLIDIDNRASRSDNYYWDMVEPSPTSLTIQMKGLLSLDKTDRLDIAVRCRSYAMQYLDWNTNAAALPDQIKNLKRIKIEDHLLSAWEKADGAIPYYRKLSRFYSAVYKFLFFVKRRVNG